MGSEQPKAKRSIFSLQDTHPDILLIDRRIISIVKDIEASLVLTRLRYWLSDAEGENKRPLIMYDGKVWLPMRDLDWFDDIGIREKQIPRIKKLLLKHQMVRIKILKYQGHVMTHWRVLPLHKTKNCNSKGDPPNRS